MKNIVSIVAVWLLFSLSALSQNSDVVVVKHLTKAEFLSKVWNYEANPNEWKYEGDKPCIIDFYTTWCCLKDVSCSSSIITRPSLENGSNTAERAPSITS